MMRLIPFLFWLILPAALLTSCGAPAEQAVDEAVTEGAMSPGAERLSKYASFRLTTNAINDLTADERKIIRLLVTAANVMDKAFWYEAYGDKDAFLESIADSLTREYAKINYGPWDRLEGNEPFIAGVGSKPLGANFYPKDMTKEEFEAADLPDKESLYTFIRRDDQGNLITVPYHKQFETDMQRVAAYLKTAATMTDNEAFKKYLQLRANAVLTDDYQESDMAWMDMKDNKLEVVIGPIETYEDRLYGYKAAHEAYVLIKDMEWSERLARYADFLPDLQQNLPVADKYKQEKPGTDAELNAYDVVYYAGDCNAGSKTIAINLPNDEEVQLKKGTRRLQLKNAMRAKFEKIMLPIAEELMVEEQRKHVTFDAFFSNTMFHEVAHGLGIKNTINGKGTVRKALQEHASALEEGKADILGLYMIRQLHKNGEIEGDLKDFYVTFMTGIFRSVRFGASSAHGVANMIRFNFFKERGAFERGEDGLYRVDFEKLEAAAEELTQLILQLQGEGDYDGVAQLVAEKGKIGAQLQADLDGLGTAGIPVDLVFEQGVKVMGF
jgi:hypothetical protein